MEITSKCLSSIDTQDKLFKGAGAAAKLLSISTHNKSWLQFASAASDARGLMRLVSWMSNIQTLANMMEKNPCGFRDVLYLLRVIAEISFKVCDNVSFLGTKASGDAVVCGQFAHKARQSLFWMYFTGIMMNLYDMKHDKYLRQNRKIFVTLFQNSCDFLTALSASGYTSFELSLAASSTLALTSALIASVECFRNAASKGNRK